MKIKKTNKNKTDNKSWVVVLDKMYQGGQGGAGVFNNGDT